MNIQPSLITKPVIAYYRRSQDKRGQRHSIEAQRLAVGKFCTSNNLQITAEYQDTASGRDDEREGLLQAVAVAKTQNMPLVILRVDRLGRKLSTLATYFEDSSLTIYVAELGMQADFLTLSVLSCVAAANVRTLSRRTKEGLAAAKAKGVVLGNPRLDEARAKSNAANRERGNATASKYGKLIVSLRDSGLSYMKIANQLNDMQIPTPSKRGKWAAATTRRIYNRSK
jgi:DNA invertase Pin-like site-specific DNA recombinase